MEEKAPIEELIKLKEDAQASIVLGEKLNRLEKNQDFQDLVEIFVTDGKKILWDNVIAFEEADMKDKGSARVENIEKFKTEIQARLIFERLLERIKEDADDAKEAVRNIDQAILEEQDNGSE